MRNKAAAVMLVASTFIWGVWCGGQVFNEMMTVPKWSASPPESLRVYDNLPNVGGLPFFPLFNPLFAVLAVVAAVAAWSSARRAKKWLMLSAGISIILSAVLIFYLAPLIQGMFQHSNSGDLSAPDIVAGVERWKLGNRIRLIIELLGFVFSILALRVWSEENVSPNVGTTA